MRRACLSQANTIIEELMTREMDRVQINLKDLKAQRLFEVCRHAARELSCTPLCRARASDALGTHWATRVCRQPAQC